MEDLLQYSQKGKWKGVPCYQCLLCQYSSTAGEVDIIKHIKERHFSRPAIRKRKPLIPVYTKSGKELDLEIEEIAIQEEPHGN